MMFLHASKLTQFLVFFIFLSACQSSVYDETGCSSIYEISKAKELGIVDLYKEACWQLYKTNLLQTDSFVVQGAYLDSVFKETSLSQFNLELKMVKQLGDSITFVLPFEKGVVPLEKPYFYTASFWKNEQKVTIGDDVIITWNRDMGDADFREYLKIHADKLSPMLSCLAIERGVLSESSK